MSEPDLVGKKDLPYQLRTESPQIWCVATLQEAMEAAKEDKTIWKISFWGPCGSRIILLRGNYAGFIDNDWRFETTF